MANLKQLLNEYRELVKQMEFGNRTPETESDWRDWNRANAETLQAMGIHTDDLYDQVYTEWERLLYPLPEQRDIIHKWHRDNLTEHVKLGVFSYDEVFYAVDELTETYTSGNNTKLQNTLNKIAQIPLMTTDVLQEIIYESCRGLKDNAIVGLDKVTIRA